MSQQETVTKLLRNYQAGNKEAVNELFELLYRELYNIADGQRVKWQQNNTLNTTALLHETYIKLVDQSHKSWESRAHFVATASRAMRHILINYARDRNRLKRGGDWKKVTLGQLEFSDATNELLSGTRIETIVLLDEALSKLDVIYPRQSRIIECRIFGGLSIKETAAALGISPITVTRSWKTARLWLCRELDSGMKS
ncbi:sigma-70 family RNA polymerase sigma factor [Rhodohalobacter sp. SW132]|uniref:sigma-70 family RNA polymerase sigma factor n=1 Tax=Rhodohalobacter sp. SW132 TaxID=2293433 RepID=UPI0013149A18|nr:sigma-70 family RNA polymerase sigma factor [Rhodohalobacter sp. SW132]